MFSIVLGLTIWLQYRSLSVHVGADGRELCVTRRAEPPLYAPTPAQPRNGSRWTDHVGEGLQSWALV